MVLQSLFLHLRRYTDISLSNGNGAVLQELLHKRNVIAIILIYLGGKEFSERVRSDILITEIIYNFFEILLNCPFLNRKEQFFFIYAVINGIKPDILIDWKRNSKDTLLFCLLFRQIEAVSVTVRNNITKPKPEYILDAKPQVRFNHKGGGDPVVRPKAKTALFHGLNNVLILLLRERNGCFICHGILQRVRILSKKSSYIYISIS